MRQGDKVYVERGDGAGVDGWAEWGRWFSAFFADPDGDLGWATPCGHVYTPADLLEELAARRGRSCVGCAPSYAKAGSA